jgi:hypothetical protein
MTEGITSAKETGPLEQSSDENETTRVRSWLARIPWARYPEFWVIVTRRSC